jgi:hypothetical protein
VTAKVVVTDLDKVAEYLKQEVNNKAKPYDYVHFRYHGHEYAAADQRFSGPKAWGELVSSLTQRLAPAAEISLGICYGFSYLQQFTLTFRGLIEEVLALGSAALKQDPMAKFKLLALRRAGGYGDVKTRTALFGNVGTAHVPEIVLAELVRYFQRLEGAFGGRQQIPAHIVRNAKQQYWRMLWGRYRDGKDDVPILMRELKALVVDHVHAPTTQRLWSYCRSFWKKEEHAFSQNETVVFSEAWSRVEEWFKKTYPNHTFLGSVE